MATSDKTDDTKPVGRPPFTPTEEMADKVETGIAMGMTEEQVASSIGCTAPTLKKYFSAWIYKARDRMRLENYWLMRTGARKGNATAQKFIEEHISTLDAADAFKAPAPTEGPVTERPPKLGKKELAVLAAGTAGDGTEWGDDLRPPPSMN